MATLFSSRVRAEVFATFFLSPGESRNAWQLARKLGESHSAVWKELVLLERLGILMSEQRERRKDYYVNISCPIEPELRTIVLKTEGAGELIKEKLQDIGWVREAFIYGS